MKYNGVILKKFSVMEDEIARLRALGDITTAVLDKDHFLKHGIERSLQICVEVVVDVAGTVLAFEALCGRHLFVRDREAVGPLTPRRWRGNTKTICCTRPHPGVKRALGKLFEGTLIRAPRSEFVTPVPPHLHTPGQQHPIPFRHGYNQQS